MSIQKKLSPALLMALGLTAGAQAETTLNMYGVFDLAFGSVEVSHLESVKARTTSVESGTLTTSFIGFRGSEDLGAGYKAQFTLESFMRLDTGANSRRSFTANADPFWSRAANVAIDSPYGKVAVGRLQNLIYGQELGFNPFGGSFGMSPTVRLTFGSFGNDKGDSGWSNAIAYYSPKMAGFSGAVMYQAGESTSDAEGDSYALGGTYANGPFAVTLGYQEVKSAEAPKADLAAGQKQKFGLLGASYDFGVAKVFAQYGQIKNKGFSGTSRIDTDLYQVGATVPVSASSKVLVSFGQSKEEAVEGGSTPDTTHSIFSLAYDYNLSKRTDVYAGYMLDDEDLDGYEKGHTFLVGVRHAF